MLIPKFQLLGMWHRVVWKELMIIVQLQKVVLKKVAANQVSVYAIDQNYSPTFTEFNTFAQNILQVYLIPASITFHSHTAINLTSNDTSPPENALLHAVSLPKIIIVALLAIALGSKDRKSVV